MVERKNLPFKNSCARYAFSLGFSPPIPHHTGVSPHCSLADLTFNASTDAVSLRTASLLQRPLRLVNSWHCELPVPLCHPVTSIPPPRIFTLPHADYFPKIWGGPASNRERITVRSDASPCLPALPPRIYSLGYTGVPNTWHHHPSGTISVCLFKQFLRPQIVSFKVLLVHAYSGELFPQFSDAEKVVGAYSRFAD